MRCMMYSCGKVDQSDWIEIRCSAFRGSCLLLVVVLAADTCVCGVVWLLFSLHDRMLRFEVTVITRRAVVGGGQVFWWIWWAKKLSPPRVCESILLIG